MRPSIAVRSALAVTLLIAVIASASHAQSDSPVISGGAGFVSTTNGGVTFVQPVIAPVAIIPIGSKFLIESRADLRGVFLPENGTSGPYRGEFFASLEYLQLNYLANSHLTISVGRYLTPFGIYNERLTPIWIRNLQDAPIIFPIGTRTSGSSDGLMLRGAALSTSAVQLNYTAYFSASSNMEQFRAGRAAGGRIGVFFTGPRLEFGASYQRFLEGDHFNAAGLHVSWQPRRAPLDIKAEYAHSPSGQGFWIESTLRSATRSTSATLLTRLQPTFRFQHFERNEFRPGDFLPGRDTQQADFGLNCYLPRNLRLNASYSRNFNDALDRNIWNVGVTYSFMVPVFPGGAK